MCPSRDQDTRREASDHQQLEEEKHSVPAQNDRVEEDPVWEVQGHHQSKED
ncbi:hypothetical protein J1N35_023172 [Gossypium stocksii]|uniref:Uncharacterized protein n=1 Tax=Gossypium stocksii TaxID=47602 RepID=A0A9D3VIA5_9ROSI|nr:hypothetical protein J1N35_023172 [Gossypium stocksii]